jgi:hypothetical protein
VSRRVPSPPLGGEGQGEEVAATLDDRGHLFPYSQWRKGIKVP